MEIPARQNRLRIQLAALRFFNKFAAPWISRSVLISSHSLHSTHSVFYLLDFYANLYFSFCLLEVEGNRKTRKKV